jgi:hypothetical protein
MTNGTNGSVPFLTRKLTRLRWRHPNARTPNRSTRTTLYGRYQSSYREHTAIADLGFASMDRARNAVLQGERPARALSFEGLIRAII